MANYDDSDDDLFNFLDDDYEISSPNNNEKKRKFRLRINFDLSGADFKERFRLSTTLAETVLKSIGADITPLADRNNASTARMKLLTTLRFLATNPMYYSVGDCHGEHVVQHADCIFVVLM